MNPENKIGKFPTLIKTGKFEKYKEKECRKLQSFLFTAICKNPYIGMLY
jgi:hypothetical protein